MIGSALLVFSSLNFTICKTEDCRQTAKLLLSGMNKAADPCDNFYEYVCGSWSTVCPVSEKPPVCHTYSLFEETISVTLREIIEESPSNNDNVALSIEKKWYKACMDQERINKTGYASITKYLTGMGGWPMIMNFTEWKSEDFPWQKVDQYYAKAAGYHLFKIQPYYNSSNAKQKTIMIYPGELSLSYLDEEEYGKDDFYSNKRDKQRNNSYEVTLRKRNCCTYYTWN